MMPHDERRPDRGEAEAPRFMRADNPSVLRGSDIGQQLTLEDGRRARDVGQQIATYSTDVAWVLAADAAIERLAATGDPFTADEVRAMVGPPVGSASAMGPRFTAAAAAGIIRKIGYRQSSSPTRHAGILAVWRGKLRQERGRG